MKAAYLYKPGDIRIEEMEMPVCGDQDVLVKVLYTGLCGSDLHYYKEGRVGDNIIKDPQVLGHESAGEVAAVGKDVSAFVPGDRVVIEPGVPCLECEFCMKGNYNLCYQLRFLGVPGIQGTFREYVVHNSKFCFKLPDNVSLQDGAMVEPLAVALHTINRAEINPGDRVLITGAGPIGCLCALMARISGAGYIVITDIDQFRLEIALQLGADEIINVESSKPKADFFDCGIEASGDENAYDTIMESVRKSGNVALLGMTNTRISFSINQILRKELQLKGIYRYVNEYPNVISLLASGRINISDLVTHTFPLSKLEEAMVTATDPLENKMKMVISNGE